MAVNVKMGVDLSGFKSGIQQGTQILKGLNSEMKAAEAEFKATGNAEQLMANKTKTLNSQIQVQKGIVDQAKTALQQMTDAGVDPADKAYQSMYATMMKAQAGMYEAQAALNGLNTSAQEAATGADKLTNSVNSIGKKISLDQVISGIGSITGALESAASKAVELGEQLWNVIMDRAKWADDTATMAAMYGIDIDKFQRMQKLVTNGMDTTVDAMLGAQDKMKRGIGNGSIAQELNDIGVAMETVIGGGKYGDVTVMRDSVDLFWEAGQALMNMGDEYDKEATAQKIFGRSWKELTDLFTKYGSREEYEKALEDVNVNSEETIENLVELNDKTGELEGNFNTLITEIVGQLAPALTQVADSLNSVLSEIIAYLQTPEGQEMLQGLADSVSSLFEDLGKIDPESVVESFTTVFNGLVDGLKWIVDNKDTLITALEGVVIGWGALKLTGGALTIMKFINGLKDLGLLGGKSGGGEASTAASGGIWTSIGNFVATNAPKAQIWSSTNGGPVLDWLTHDSPFATMFNGIESPAEWFERQKSEFEQRKESFASDWEENEIYKFFKKGATDLVSEWTKNGQKSIAEYQANVEKYSGSDMFNIWDVMTRYTTINGTPEDSAKMQDFAKHFFSWWNDEITDAGLDELAGAMSDEDFFSFKDAMEKILNGDTLYSSEEQQAFADAMNAAIKAAEGLMNPAEVKLVADPNSATDLATQVGIVKVPAKLVYSSQEVGYANGLPYVPNDGLYKLHRGEKVVPAREAGRSFSSNLYVENMNMNGGLSADALAASIAARNQRMMSGYGS